jgi:hypothetical protein
MTATFWRHTRVSVLAAVLAVPVLLVTDAGVSASCALPDPPAQLAEADAAFVGRYLGRGREIRPSSEAGPGLGEVFFEVVEWIKGDLGGPRLTVASTVNTSIDMTIPEGTVVGVLIHVDGGLPTTNGCLLLDPAILRSVAAPASTPDGSGPPALLVGGDFATSRIIALDTRGAVVGYGAGEGQARDLDICPGGRRFIELFHSFADGESRVVTRDIATLEVVRMIDPRRLPGYDGGLDDIECVNDAGDAVGFVFGLGIATFDDAPRLLWKGSARTVLISADRAIVVPEGDPLELHLVNLANGRDVVIHRLPDGRDRGGDWYGDVHEMSLSPDGDRMALTDSVSGGGVDGQTLRVFRLADGAPLLAVALPRHDGSNAVAWVDESTLLTVALGGSEQAGVQVAGTVRLLATSDGSEVARWTGWDSSPLAVTPDLIVGMQSGTVVGSGRLIAVPLRGGTPGLVRQLDAPWVNVVVPLPALDGAALLAATTPLASAAPVMDGGVQTDGSPLSPIAVAGVLVLVMIGLGAITAAVVVRRRPH